MGVSIWYKNIIIFIGSAKYEVMRPSYHTAPCICKFLLQGISKKQVAAMKCLSIDCTSTHETLACFRNTGGWNFNHRDFTSMECDSRSKENVQRMQANFSIKLYIANDLKLCLSSMCKHNEDSIIIQ